MGADDLTGGSVSGMDHSVLGADQGTLAVEAPSDRGNHAVVTLKGRGTLTTGGIPDCGTVISQSGRGTLAARAPDNAVDVAPPRGQSLDDVTDRGV